MCRLSFKGLAGLALILVFSIHMKGLKVPPLAYGDHGKLCIYFLNANSIIYSLNMYIASSNNCSLFFKEILKNIAIDVKDIEKDELEKTYFFSQ